MDIILYQKKGIKWHLFLERRLFKILCHILLTHKNMKEQSWSSQTFFQEQFEPGFGISSMEACSRLVLLSFGEFVTTMNSSQQKAWTMKVSKRRWRKNRNCGHSMMVFPSAKHIYWIWNNLYIVPRFHVTQTQLLKFVTKTNFSIIFVKITSHINLQAIKNWKYK